MSIRYLSYFLQLLAIILITFVDSIFAQSLPTYPLPQFGTVTVSPDFQVNGAGQNIDTIEFWKAPDSTETLMFVTAKDNNVVEVWQYPFEGNELPPLTHSTFSGGQVNGLAIDQEADLLYVSIGNTSNTVSVFSLPDLTFQFSFIESGVNLQTEPNLAILNLTNGNKNIYVSADFPVYIHDAEDGNYINEFTPTKGLETMASDSFYQRLYIPDENGRTGVYVYNPDGTAYTDNGSNVFGTTQFSADAEGIIVYNYPLNDPVDMGNGFIVVADQRFQTDFEFFDRITWDHLGKLHISGVSNTDGIASYPYPLPDYPLGVFAAVDNDQSVAIVGWDKIFAEILPTITVTLPNGGESWSAGSQQFIAWNDNIAENVKIELYKSGTFNSTITSSTSSDGSYTWAIPAGATPASDYTIKITSINDGNITDISDTEFTITAPQPIQTKFAVIGDYGDDNQDEQAVADLINTWNVDLIITTGDNSYDATPIDQNVGKYYSDYIGNYNGSYGTGSPVNKFFPSLGNHDYSDGGGITAYLNYFTLPGISGNTSGNERYYDYVIDNIHFFAINSVGSEPDGNDGASIQANWLQTQMTNSTANWQIVYFHHSPYSSGQHGSSDIMKWDFAQWGADAVMSGHDHTYERLEADGLTYFVNGLGGRSIYNFGSPLPETQFRYNGDFGAMLVEATESTLTAKFYNTNGDLIDTWTKDNTVISITEPNGGEIWQTGSLYQIKWNDAISENVKIELYKGGAIHSQITSSTSSDGSYNWTIPASTAQGVDYRIKITSVDDDNITGSSDLDFSIIDVSFVTVSSPNGGESWQAGTQQTITWDDNIIEDVKIDLYKGAVFNSNINNTALDFPVDLYNSPESEKTIFVNLTRPIDIPANVIYKITAFDADHGREDPPEGEFYINGNGPLDLFPGATQANGNDVINDFTFNIPSSWLVDGANELRFVRLYSTGFQIEAATLLVDGVASYGNNAYSWNIPTGITPASDYTVKITNISDPNLSDLSNTDFSITTTPFITVTTPNGGESWQAGTQQTITWNDNITENVKIELYKNGTPNSTIIASTTSNGSYSWDIPSGTIPASDYTIKITSINDGNITDVSDAVFNITAASFITVNSPNGGESWQAGTQQTITWNDNITENVKIELYKNGTPNSTIVASTTSNGSYNWDIPSSTSPASDYTIKITSINDGNITDVSDAVFDITAASFITVTAPDGGENWQAGTQQTITWNDNISENVKIELYKNASLNSTIVASTTSNGSYSWDIPSGTTPASDYTVKITSVTDPGLSDISNAVFDITAASFITVTAPDGGESWEAGTQQTITWNDNITVNVKIELYKNGTPNSTIIASTSSNGSYDWDIPSGTTPASDYTIKITSINDGNISDVSDAVFNITAASFITVTAPDGGEIWQAGTQQTITWNDNISENVKIELFKGGTPNSTIVTSTTSDGSYSWDIPSGTTPASDYTIKITSVDNGTITDVSDAVFDITAASFIIVTSPNGGESLQSGTQQTITWNDNIVENVKIEFFKGGALDSEITASTTSDGSYNWDILAGTTPASDYTIKITSVTDPGLHDFSDADFSIFDASFVMVSSPNGGENWQAGTHQTISWDDNIIEDVKIDLYKGGVFNSNINNITALDFPVDLYGSPETERTVFVNLTIPVDIPDSVIYKFIAFDADHGGEDPPEGELYINGNGPLELFPGATQANGNDVINDFTFNIPSSWLVDGANELRIVRLYSTGFRIEAATCLIDGVSSYGNNTYSWNIPAGTIPGTDYTVMITSVGDPNLSSSSDAIFSITAAPFITVNTPNGGESWQAGTQQTITWNDNIDDNVKIDLFKGGTFNSAIASSTTSDGSYDWNIPSGTTPDTDYTIMITSVAVPGLSDFSNASFDITLASFITVETPNGGESWQAGAQQTISWSDNITGNVKIELFKGGSFNSTIATSTTSDGSYNWTIPGGISQGVDYRIKITSVLDVAISDLSNGNFTITATPFITISTPNGGESWEAGTQHTISWDDNIIEDVKIDLYEGGVFNSNINNITALDFPVDLYGSPESEKTVFVNLSIPVDIPDSVIYKITAFDADHGGDDAPEGEFYINGNGPLDLFPGANQANGNNVINDFTFNIPSSWLVDGANELRFVRLYSTGFQIEAATLLVDGVSSYGNNTYSWNIPVGTVAGSDYAVKITSITDPGLNVFSDNNFTITESTIVIDFTASLIVYDNCSNSSTLRFGTAPDATNCYDPFHDLFAPPPAPSFAYDSRFTSCGEDLIKDIRATNTDSSTTWDVYYHPETGCNPITLSWNPNELPTNGNFYLIDPFGGSLVNINMRQTSIYTDSFGYNNLQILFNNSSELSIDFSEGWNTVSLPIEVQDNYYKTLFPNALDGTLFGYDGSYYSSDSIKVENGYWLRFNNSGFVDIEGIKILQMDLDLTSGWNFIGGPACDIVYNSIEDPGGIIIPGTLFGFNGSYFNADTLLRGKGYWIRTNASGIITLDCSAAPNLPKVSESEILIADLTEFIKVKLEDNKGNNQTLYFSGTLEDDVNIESYSLPPIPPTGIFDSRISGGYRLSESEEIEIMIQSDDYPLKVQITGTNYGNTKGYLLKQFADNVEVGDIEITDGIEVIINNENVSLLKIQLNSRLPANFVLEQNYPNPFNPSTKIKYRVPVRGSVNLKVINSLGQEIATLVHEEKAAGTYEKDFDASNLASGIYFYRIKLIDTSTNTAEGPIGQVIVETKKMVLLR